MLQLSLDVFKLYREKRDSYTYFISLTVCLPIQNHNHLYSAFGMMY